MSYYSVDLLSSLPSGSPSGAPAATPAEEPVPKEAPAPVRQVIKSVPHEAIKITAPKPKQPPLPRHTTKVKPVTKTPASIPSWATASNLASPSAATNAGPSGSSAVSAKAGQPFPFPWYLKTVSDKLERQWHPPDDAQSGLSCQVTFVIGRSGQVSDVKITHASGDPFFDQLAQRATLAANPMPPLPSGFPEPSLKVHMTFERDKI